MPLETGVPTDVEDIIDKIRAHALARGWTIVRTNGAGGDPSGTQVTMTDPNSDSLHIHMTPDATNFRINFGQSNADGGALDEIYEHTGSPQAFTLNVHPQANIDVDGPYENYWIFGKNTAASDPGYVHVVVEITPGVFWHMGFGTCEKAGPYTGGGYLYCKYWGDAFADAAQKTYLPFQMRPGPDADDDDRQCYLQADGSIAGDNVGFSPNWVPNYGMINNTASFTFNMQTTGVFNATQRLPFIPNYFLGEESTVTLPDENQFLGHTPDIRICSMENRVGGEIVTNGGDNWYVFPMHSVDATVTAGTEYTVSGGTGTLSTGLLGLAYRQI